MKCPIDKETGIKPIIDQLRELHEWVKYQNDMWAISDLDQALHWLDRVQQGIDTTSDFFENNPAPQTT